MSLTFSQLEQELAEVPRTWVPALLRVLVQRAEAVRVFKPEGAVVFVQNTLDDVRARRAAALGDLSDYCALHTEQRLCKNGVCHQCTPQCSHGTKERP